MADKLKISIITVCLNSVETIERTIISVLSQTYTNVEYLIIDGASTDGTCEVLNKYKDRLAYYCSEPDGGLYHAMNKGLQHATGDIIAFLNSDDWYVEDALSCVGAQFERTKADVLCLGVTRENENGERNDRYSKVRIDEKGFERLEVFHPATFAKKSIFDEIGDFNTGYQLAADYDWLVRMKRHGYMIECINQVTTYYSDGGLSSKYWYEAQDESRQIDLRFAQSKEERADIDAIYENKKVYRKYYEMLEQKQLCYIDAEDMKQHIHGRVYIFGAGNMGKECRQLLQQNHIRIRGFIDNNKAMWGKMLEGYPVISPSEIDIENDVVVITVMQYEEEIKKQLIQMGMRIDRMIMFRFLKDKVLAKIRADMKSLQKI